jgi:hypothetical protein
VIPAAVSPVIEAQRLARHCAWHDKIFFLRKLPSWIILTGEIIKLDGSINKIHQVQLKPKKYHAILSF